MKVILMCKQGYKETEIGCIPEDWRVVNLGEVLTESFEKAQVVREDRILTVKLRVKGVVKREYKDKDVKVSPNTTYYVRRKGQFIYGKQNLHKGALGIVPDSLDGYLSTRDVPAFDIDISLIDPYYLFYYFSRPEFYTWLENFADGTGSKRIHFYSIENLPLPLPPLPEQKKIAEILSTVDEEISTVDREIEHAERMKKGLLSKLLTEGIGHTEFKETEIGRIPKDWQVVKLGNVVEVVMGQSPPSEYYNTEGEGLPFMQGKNEFGAIYPNPSMYTSMYNKVSEVGDVLLSVRAPVGEVNISNMRIALGRGLAALRSRKEIDNFYLFYSFLSFLGDTLKNISGGSTFKSVTKEQIKSLLLPLPPLPEQKKIAEILSTVDEYIQTLREKKKHLEQVKKGLLNDLITGKRRVKVDAVSNI
ncbi:hypothetical protein GM182_06020 [bacterium 3DAC]|nr:hypothetical protein GM182_06020 [bacterium 3DAC]